MSEKSETITWSLIRNVGFFVSAAVVFTGSQMGLSNKIDLINQKVDFLIESQETKNKETEVLRTEVNDLKMRIKILETNGNN